MIAAMAGGYPTDYEFAVTVVGVALAVLVAVGALAAWAAGRPVGRRGGGRRG